MNYTTKIALFVVCLLVTGMALARQPGYRNRYEEVPPVISDRYGPPGTFYAPYGTDRNGDGYGTNDYRADHEF